MKFSRHFLILFFGLSVCLHAEEQRSAEDLFFEGNVRAAEEAYAEAVPLYEAALAKRPSPNIHYNLGNAYYHLGDWGRARIHWERTLAMEPRHIAAGRNLQALLKELGLPETMPGFWTRAAGFLSYNQWVWLGMFSFWGIVFSLLARQWKKKGWLVLPAGFGAAGLFLAAASLLLLSPARDLGIILEEQAALRVAPAPGSPVATPLRPAQRVRVAGTYGNFVRVLLENGQEGFLQSDQLEKIR